MPTNVYEGMFLLDANKYSRDPGGVSGQVVQAIEKCGGDVLVSRLWAEQKLAFQIGNHRKGAYWLTYFRMDSDRLTELKRATRLNNNVIRDLVLAVDDRLVDTLVEHAKGTTKPADTEKKPADTEKKPADTEKKPADTEKKPAVSEEQAETPAKEPADDAVATADAASTEKAES